jgi:hypothetical protein
VHQQSLQILLWKGHLFKDFWKFYFLEADVAPRTRPRLGHWPFPLHHQPSLQPRAAWSQEVGRGRRLWWALRLLVQCGNRCGPRAHAFCCCPAGLRDTRWPAVALPGLACASWHRVTQGRRTRCRPGRNSGQLFPLRLVLVARSLTGIKNLELVELVVHLPRFLTLI